MITEIDLHNWKSFENAELQIDQITFLIGTNASGKSNVVDALQFLSMLPSCSRLSDVCAAIRGGLDWIVRKGSDFAELSVKIRTEKSDYVYRIKFTVDGKDSYVVLESLTYNMRDDTWRDVFHTEGIITTDSGDMLKVSFPKAKFDGRKTVLLRKDLPVLAQIQGANVIKDVREISASVAEQLSNIFVFLPDPDSMRDFKPLSENLEADGSNVAGVIAAMPENIRQEFEKKIYRYVKGLPERDLCKVWTEPVGRFGDAAMLYCEEKWNDGSDSIEMDARSMSYGTLRFIAIIVALLYSRPDSLIVIEEIDNGLHPSRAGELVYALTDIASNGNFDVLCTTHNPVLIDALGGEMLLSVSCISRNGVNGSSLVTKLEDIPDFLHDLASFTPGEMMVKRLFS